VPPLFFDLSSAYGAAMLPKKPPLKVTYANPKTLKPNARNSRQHTDEQIEMIARSIERFGWTNPILTDGKSGVIAGHARLAAALKRGDKQVPVIPLSALTPQEKRAYVIADNRLAQLAGWDDSVLADELRALSGEGFELALMGYTNADLELLEAGWEADKELIDSLSSGNKEESLATVKVQCRYDDVDAVVTAVRSALKKAGLKDVEVTRP
jgi:ParB-like chromosome segregation protein Spo0J